jgi:hypothetical protein
MIKTSRSQKDSMILFHSICHVYLVGVEALFNDTIKMIYLFSEAANGKILRFEEIKKDKKYTIWRIKDVYKQIFGMTPIFLEGKRLNKIFDIRNAIAHAQAKYDPEADQGLFWSIKEKDGLPRTVYQKMSLLEFFTVHMEVMDLIDSVRRSTDVMLVQAMLTSLYDAG